MNPESTAVKFIPLVVCGLSLLLAPAPLRAADAELLYADDFATLDPGWGEASEQKSVAGGKLLVRIDSELVLRSLYQGKKFPDADVRLKITEVKGETDQPAGIIFWGTDRDNHYSALIRPDGKLYVSRRMNGVWIRPISIRECAGVKVGTGQTNELRVVTSGPTATIYVNNQEAVAFRGFPPAGGQRIGVQAASGSEPGEWTFADLRVYQGPAPPADLTLYGDAILFADDFSRLDPTWGDAEDRWNVDGGKLILKPRANASVTRLYTGTLFGDADIRVKVSQIDSAAGGTNQLAGVVFWGDDSDNYYLAAIDAGGNYFVGRKTKGEWINPQDKIVRSEVLKGVGRVNEIRVVTEGESAKISVNGKIITTLGGYKHPEKSVIGLQAESDEQETYTWAFSGLTVRKPE
jgi:hypothetical protein